MIKKIFIFLVLMFFIPFMVNAEELKMEWQKSWGGSGFDDFGNVVLTETGDIIVCGNTSSTDIENLSNKGDYDAIIVKYDKEGNLLWQKIWGGSGTDTFYDLILTETDDIIVSGYTSSADIEGISFSGSSVAIIAKYDKKGNLLWQKSWGGNKNEKFSKVLLTETGDILVIGNTSSTDIEGLTTNGWDDAIIVKYDKDGNLLWQKSWGGNDDDKFWNLNLAKNGDIIICGITRSKTIEGLVAKGNYDAIILKYDKDGNMLWQKSWGGSAYDYFNNLTLTETDDIIISGYSSSTDIEGLTNKGSNDAIVIMYDKDGNLLWQKNWGGSGSERFENLLITKTGDIVVYGYSPSTDIEGLINKGSNDAIIVKYDKDGNILWQKSWGGAADDFFQDFVLTELDDVLAIGFTLSTDIDELTNKGGYDSIIVKYDKNGNLLWYKSWGGNSSDVFSELILTETGDIIIYGDTSSSNIEGLSIVRSDQAIVKYSIKYNIDSIITDNGIFTVEQRGNRGIITTTPNDKYITGQIRIKDRYGEVLNVDIIKLQDNIYSFELNSDVIVEVYFVKDFSINLVNPKNGDVEVDKIDADHGIVIFTPHSGFEFDKVIVKNSKGELVDVIKQDDGTYLFSLDDDVSVEVLFKEEVVNPKTGVIDVISTLFVGFIISFIGYTLTKRNCNCYDL